MDMQIGTWQVSPPVLWLATGFVTADLPKPDSTSYRRVDIFHSAQVQNDQAAVALTTCAISGCVHLRFRLRHDASMQELRGALAQDVARTLGCRLATLSEDGLCFWGFVGLCCES